ncbi:MAG: TIR domain-containing protein [Gammaproteobacteria bacterium]|nr:TIR domain-containing protein [Gammaproteobacteria bacterium]
MTDPSRAVFVSYASQDAEAAQRICAALRAAGIEVWLDQAELRGGDAWDHEIRRQIHDCALFLPVISANTAARAEGYFRLEWALAEQRSQMIARNKAFILPVCLDHTPESGADVPDSFQRVQWTRLPQGNTPPAFAERVRRLLSAAPTRPSPAARTGDTHVAGTAPASAARAHGPRGSKATLVLIAAAIAVSIAYLALNTFWASKHSPARTPATPGTAATAERSADAVPAFAPPPHSVAVVPFVNISGDKEQEYFSDGLTEELLNSLARIDGLQVAARTSSFSFKGEKVDVGTIARKLNVAAVLEGSVRRSGHTVRITAQLVNAVTGFHLWSETYDRDLGDVLRLQTDIANAVAAALRVTLLGDVAAKIERGGTHNPAAFDAYLRASRGLNAPSAKSLQAAIAAFGEAIRLDPHYALAFAGRSIALSGYTTEFAIGAAARTSGFEGSLADARRAIALAPDVAEAHLALAEYSSSGPLDLALADSEYQRALALAPSNTRALGSYGRLAVDIGHTEEGIGAARRAVMLDPLNARTHRTLGLVLYNAHHYAEALTVFDNAIALNPDDAGNYAFKGFAYYVLGNLPEALASCQSKADYWSYFCLALAYEKMARHTDAKAELAKGQAELGDAAAYQYAWVYTQWGDHPKALEWLEAALHLQDPGLIDLEVDPLLDPLRSEPRFQAVQRALKFPP